MRYQYLFIVFFLIFSAFTVLDFRRRRISGEYFLAANSISGVAITFLANENLLIKVSNILGITLPSNLAMFSISILGLVLSYAINKELRALANKVALLAQEIALLKNGK